MWESIVAFTFAPPGFLNSSRVQLNDPTQSTIPPLLLYFVDGPVGKGNSRLALMCHCTKLEILCESASIS
jgi:hypothetical protein